MRPSVRRTALFLALMLAAGGATAQGADSSAGATENTLAVDVHSIVNTGHLGGVLDVVLDERRNLVFSAGEDGTVRVWNAQEGVLYRVLRVTSLAAQMIAVDPANPRVAVVVSDGLRSVYLAVWDWEQEKQILRLPLKDAPLFLRFSGQGNFLVFGQSSWQSLEILDARTGAPVPFHPEGFGIVGFAETSKSEKTIMTYQVSGWISYWDLASGSLTLEVPTVAYLSHMRISRDRRYLVGNTGKEVVLIDALSGAVRGRAPLNGDASLDIAADDDRVAAVPIAGGSPREWAVGPESLIAEPLTVKGGAGLDSDDAFQALCYGPEGLLVAGRSGAISEISSSGNLRLISKNVLADLTGFDARHGLLAVASRDWIRIFQSDFLLNGSQSLGFVHSVLVDNPWKSEVGLSFLSDTSLLAWTKDDGPPRFAVIDLPGELTRDDAAVSRPAFRFRPLPSGFRAPLADLRVAGSSLLGIENGGLVRMVDLATGASRFDARISALSTVVAVSPTELIGGRSTALSSTGSLVRINTRTGETVSIPGRNVFTWDLLFDPAAADTGGPVLYSLGVDDSGSTTLLRHDGSGFERETLIASVPEENLDASLALDPVTHTLYASLGRASIVSWDGSKEVEIPTGYGNVRGLFAGAGLIISMDRDSTLAIEEKFSGSRLAELCLFADGEWAATVQGGGYLASPGGDAHVKVFVNGTMAKAAEDYRLRIECW